MGERGEHTGADVIGRAAAAAGDCDGHEEWRWKVRTMRDGWKAR